MSRRRFITLALRINMLEERAVPAIITVTDTGDNVASDGVVTLREAINSISGAGPASPDVNAVGPYGTNDTVLFSAAVFNSPQTINMSGHYVVSKSIAINGPSSLLLTIKSIAAVGATSRVFSVSGTSTVSLTGLTITGGNTTGNGSGIDLTTQTLNLTDVVVTANKTSSLTGGGGIRLTTGVLNITNSVIASNGVNSPAGEGGGILVTSTGTVTITDSSVAGNSAGSNGGGIHFNAGGTLNLLRSTISGNKSNLSTTTAGGAGGGGGLYLFNTTATIANSTISGNSTNAGGNTGPGGGISCFGTTASVVVQIRNSTIAFNNGGTSKGGGINRGGTNLIELESVIVSNNTSSGGGPDIFGNLELTEFSLIQNPSGLSVTSNVNSQFGVDPQLFTPLSTIDGGVTQYHRVDHGPAIDKGSNLTGLTTDQRGTGFNRVSGPNADVGAYELQVATPPPRVGTVTINGGAAQRSRITRLDVSFDQHINLAGGVTAAFQVKRQSDSATATIDAPTSKIDDSGSGTTITLRFNISGAVVDGMAGNVSLADGRYTLTAISSAISNANGNLDGDGNGTAGGDYVLASAASPNLPSNIFRLFGDSDGNGTINGLDFIAFRMAFLTSNTTFDFDGDGLVLGGDFAQFRLRFLLSI